MKNFKAHIYRPKGDGSGVTIGYGYDMGARTKQEIYDDLTSVGMPPDQASRLSQAAGKKGASADNFIAAQKGGATLSEPQALRLFSSKIQGYELAVQQAVTVPLNQNQFDALTSLAYNAPAALKRGSRLVHHLNNADYQSAADEILRWNKVTVKGKTVPSRGLTKRRIRERALFCEEMNEMRDALPAGPTTGPHVGSSRTARASSWRMDYPRERTRAISRTGIL